MKTQYINYLTNNDRSRIVILAIILTAGCFITAQSQHKESSLKSGEKLFEEQISPLLKGMGDQQFEISSDNRRAQTYFNQALALTYGFNHLEAGRSYEQVAVLEPNEAIAYWGRALVLGPNINLAMPPDVVIPAYENIQKALSLKAYASQLERDLIDALAVRYSRDESMSDRKELDEKYADAMRKLGEKYPENATVLTLLASALMNLHPWDYWNSDGTPKAWTPEILEVLESGLEKHPNHAGLIHYYIHAVEASKNPGRAMEGADILADLIPGAGHIVHMPSHIYIRTGRYHAGVLANERAIKVDTDYITQCRQQGIYPLAYAPHNRHFLWSMATLEGSSAKAINAAEHMAKHTDQELMGVEGLSFLQHYWVTPIYAYVRFGKWDTIFSLPKPDASLLYPTGVWHYARGIAFTATGEFHEAEDELRKLKHLSGNESLKEVTLNGINDAYHVLQIARLTLEGELLAKQGKIEISVATFRKAIQLEDDLKYNEPADWHYPVRQSLGAVLLDAGKYEDAEAVYRQDLENFPKNGWSLYGLWQSLSEQGRAEEAREVRAQFREAWKYADFNLTASRVL